MKSFMIILSLMLSLQLAATIINIPGDQESIQAGIDVAANGDTILVHPGTYLENIEISSKNLYISSLYLTTQDTSYISQTIIDGNQEDSVIKYYGGIDSTSTLCGLTITNGSGYYGGGIYCESSNHNFLNLNVTGNTAVMGGGLFCEYNSPIIENCTVSSNTASEEGGGLYFWKYCSPVLDNVIVSSNIAGSGGGGIFSRVDCNIQLINSLIEDNISSDSGGGINNSYASEISLINTTIRNNSALMGGGIYSYYYGEVINFDPVNRSNIYSNNITNNERGFGADIFAHNCNVIVDTFTTLNPTDYYASPLANLSFDILHEIGIPLIDSDLFVSVEGNDDNSGTVVTEPLKTIRAALSKIYSDSLNVNTIHLAPGTYSASTNGETFPINWSNYVWLSGDNETNTILDAEENSGVIRLNSVTDIRLENLTIKNGKADYGGGINCLDSDISLENIILINNQAEDLGGGIYFSNSNSTLQNITLLENSCDVNGGGISLNYDSTSNLDNVIIEGNTASLHGGGIFCSYNSNLTISNARIEHNSTIEGSGGGIYCASESNLELGNVFISENFAGENGGAISCGSGSSIIFNEDNLCDIYLNFAGNLANEIYSTEFINVVVDTFTVAEPDDYFTAPIDNYTFDISNGYITPVAQNLFVSPNGSNSNSGLSAASPMQTITFALLSIIPDSTITNNIHLSNGTYYASQSGERFPLNCRNFVSIIGEDQELTILDGEDQTYIFNCYQDSALTISDLTIANGNNAYGGGINCSTFSDINIQNVTITNNTAIRGGGLYCYHSSPNLNNVNIINNHAVQRGGGVYCAYDSNPIITNSSIESNYAASGGGIVLRYNDGEAYLENVLIANNSASGAAGISCHSADAILKNVRIIDNSSSGGAGGLASSHSHMILTNVLVKGNSAQGYGGGLSCGNYPDMELNNVIIVDNSSAEQGGGLYCRDNYQIDLENVVVADNQADGVGSGICCYNTTGSSMNIINSIVWHNQIYGSSSAVTIAYSNISGDWYGNTNIDEDPLFLYEGDRPYLLQVDSPCIDAGDPNEWYNDPEDDNNPGFALYPALGTIINDMGAYGGPKTDTWEYVSVEDNEIIKPIEYNLCNHPNPFNPSTTITFSLKNSSRVELIIYNIKGQKVKTLVQNQLAEGSYSMIWNGDDAFGKSVSSGVYFYKLVTDNNTVAVKKMMLIK